MSRRLGANAFLVLLFATSTPARSQQSDTTLAEPDDTLPTENQGWVDHARLTGFSLQSLTSRDSSDLRFLRDVIGDRRVVQLGESGHGVAEFNQVKVRLIRFLHESLGFDVVAFESSLFECYKADEGADGKTADQLMRSCISGVWYTDEILPLFEYVLETRRTDRPLRLAGFDLQVSTGTAGQRSDFLREVLTPIDPAFAVQIASLDSTLRSIRYPFDELRDTGTEFIDAYSALSQTLEEREDDLVQAGVNRDDVRVASRLAKSTFRYVQYLSLMVAPGPESTRMRDEGMAENLVFLLEELYPGKKIITWGHNFHLRHLNEAVHPDPVKTMGQWVAESYRDELYTVGLYMRWGRGTMPNRQVFNVVPPASGSLESILGHVGEPYFFLDLRRTAQGPDGVWVRRPIVTKTWGQADVTMTLLDQYDAILFVDRVHPPSYR